VVRRGARGAILLCQWSIVKKEKSTNSFVDAEVKGETGELRLKIEKDFGLKPSFLVSASSTAAGVAVMFPSKGGKKTARQVAPIFNSRCGSSPLITNTTSPRGEKLDPDGL